MAIASLTVSFQFPHFLPCFFSLWGCWKSHNPLTRRLFCGKTLGYESVTSWEIKIANRNPWGWWILFLDGNCKGEIRRRYSQKYGCFYCPRLRGQQFGKQLYSKVFLMLRGFNLVSHQQLEDRKDIPSKLSSSPRHATFSYPPQKTQGSVGWKFTTQGSLKF